MKYHIAKNTELGVRIERVDDPSAYAGDPDVLVNAHLPPGVPPHFLKVDNGKLVELSDDEKIVRLEQLAHVNRPKAIAVHELIDERVRLQAVHEKVESLIPQVAEEHEKLHALHVDVRTDLQGLDATVRYEQQQLRTLHAEIKAERKYLEELNQQTRSLLRRTRWQLVGVGVLSSAALQAIIWCLLQHFRH